jgi:hypothetical protein
MRTAGTTAGDGVVGIDGAKYRLIATGGAAALIVAAPESFGASLLLWGSAIANLGSGPRSSVTASADRTVE